MSLRYRGCVIIKKKIIIIIVILGIISALCVIQLNKNSGNLQGDWIVRVVDSESKNELDNAFVIVTDLDKKYEINKESNIITLPQKPSNNKKSEYPYGYTIITYSNGYLPRIDHNITMGKNACTKIEIELSKPVAFENRSYTEVFHSLGEVLLVDLFEHYKLNNN